MPVTVGIAASGHGPDPGVPGTIPDIECWYDFSDTASLTLVSTTHISVALDKSGNGYHARMGTDANRPILTADLIKVGKNAANFLNCYMNIDTAPGPLASTKPFSIFAAVKLTATLAYRDIFGGSIGGNIVYRMNNAHKHSLVKNQVVEIGVGTTALATVTPIIVGVAYTAAGVYTFYNANTANGTGTNNQTFTAGGYPVLCDSIGEPWHGAMGELVKYRRDLTTAERNSLYTYLSGKWI